MAARTKLDFRSSFSRSYLGTLAEEQDAAIARLHREIPQARVSRRYQVLENGFAVSVPYARLPELLSSRIATRVYPSLTYHVALNRGPGIIGAPQFSSATGAKGDGVKVAVVDDGVDHQHPFLDPKGFSYPPGFPKGETSSTTPKVIVARAFAGPNSNGAPLDRDRSFHGTFVAGVIAGVPMDIPAGRPGFCIKAEGGCHPAVAGISGVAPRAYIGNYRVFNVPNPAPIGGCCSANSPEIVAAFEAAVKDGMDVINFSGGGPQADPRTDILIDAVSNVVKAGVVPVISAGQRPRFLRPRNRRLPRDGAGRDQRRRGGERPCVRPVPGGGRLRAVSAGCRSVPPTRCRPPGSRPINGSSTLARSTESAVSSATPARRFRPAR